jgi:hypothetical protein
VSAQLELTEAAKERVRELQAISDRTPLDLLGDSGDGVKGRTNGRIPNRGTVRTYNSRYEWMDPNRNSRDTTGRLPGLRRSCRDNHPPTGARGGERVREGAPI